MREKNKQYIVLYVMPSKRIGRGREEEWRGEGDGEEGAGGQRKEGGQGRRPIAFCAGETNKCDMSAYTLQSI